MPRTPSFEEMFGVGSAPIASYFGLPQGASADTRFAPQARALLAEGEQYQREMTARDAEMAAEQLLGGAAQMSDQEIQQQFVQNPRLIGTQAAPVLNSYMQFRQSTTPQTDVTLGPIFREQIQDPYHREKFQERMMQGMSANDAFDAYRADEYNSKFELQLAEAGVPETEYAKLKTASGKFIPGAVARASAAAKAAAKVAGTGRKVQPLDEEVEFLKDAIEQRQKIFEATGRQADLAKDSLMQDYVSRYEKATAEKLSALRPPPKPVDDLLNKYSSSPTQKGQVPAKDVPDSPPVFDVNISPEENKARMEQYELGSKEREAKQKVEESIARAWTNKKLDLTDKIGALYKSPQEIIAVANAILSGNPIPVKKKLASGNEVEDLVPYRLYLAQKLGLKLTDTAFEEPESQSWNRVGTQKVTNDELIREWAESILEAHQAGKSAQAQQIPTASGIAEDQDVDKLLDIYAPKK